MTSSTATASWSTSRSAGEAVGTLDEGAALGWRRTTRSSPRSARARRSDALRDRRHFRGPPVAPACCRLQVLPAAGTRTSTTPPTSAILATTAARTAAPRAATRRRRTRDWPRRTDRFLVPARDAGRTTPIELPLPGLYNVYNALAAASLACALGASLNEIKDELAGFSAAFGRLERIEAGDRTLLMLLIKNPAGANEAIRTLVQETPPKTLLIALNDAIADGRDVSWIWDVDFEHLLEQAERIVVSGDRAAELALRFLYGGFDRERLEIVTDLEGALDRALQLVPAGSELVVLPTYTAMLALRGIAVERGLVRPYWERASKVKVGHLYPDYLNIYADRGTSQCSNGALCSRPRARRCPARPGRRGRPDAFDLLYVGGGQDREQALIAPDLAAKGPDPGRRRAGRRAARGLRWLPTPRPRLPRPRRAVHARRRSLSARDGGGERRMIGDVLLACELEPGARRTLAGFENHAGRTRLDPGANRSGA